MAAAQPAAAVGGSGAAGLGTGGLVKTIVSESDRPKHIKNISFGLLDGAQVMRLSHLHVTSYQLYRMPPSRQPAEFGCLDPRLGISNKRDECATCGQKLAECAGHFGFIKLELPVFHIGYFKATLAVLQNVCKTCSRVLLGAEDRRRYNKVMRDPRVDALKKVNVRKRITEMCKKVHFCPYCGAPNGTVKKVPNAPTLRIIHEKFKGKDKDVEEERRQFIALFDAAIDLNADMSSHVARSQEPLSPLRVLEILRGVPPEDMDLLWTNAARGPPESMIMTHLLVPPVCIRPSVEMDSGGGSNEDDLTVTLQEIIEMNKCLRLALTDGKSIRHTMQVWELLQVKVASYINGDLPGMPNSRPKKVIRGLCQRLKGKQGRFRGNLSGKRVDFSARTVISPDPNLGIFEVGVPQAIAEILTYPERVTALNLARMRVAVTNGPEYPGANFIRLANGFTKALQYGDRAKVAASLKVGDIVERHLIDGDAVLFNRQPSLHKMSIMSHRARVMPSRTLRFNECVCTPYNADFDGDEMNLHVPQTEEARAEAALLMDVRENMITPRSGQPLIAANQDFLTASFLLTRRDTFLTRDQFCAAVCTLDDAREHIDMPMPTILKPVPLWTGKQVMSCLLRPNARTGLRVNLEVKEDFYAGVDAATGLDPLWRCPNDGWVYFRNGELLCGNLAKGTLGASKSGLVLCLIRDHAAAAAARMLLRLTKMCTRWLTNRGFSIGIEDVTPGPTLSERKEALLQVATDKCQQAIAAFKSGQLQLLPGCDSERSLESTMNGILGGVRSSVGDMCMERLPQYNAPRIMATCGSKGSVLNICQMIACVGQQSVNGDRIADGFLHRTLPAFEYMAKDAPAKGFVANSFYTGLSASEFFFHTMGGREGLVDTAVKTAETGYMQRRMMKALEDLSVQYDSTVRSSGGDVVQFIYGDDGLNPQYMEKTQRPVDFNRLLSHVLAAPSSGRPLEPEELLRDVAAALGEPRFTRLLPHGDRFIKEVQACVEGIAAAIRAARAAGRCGEDDVPPAHRVTVEQLAALLDTALAKLTNSAMQPGEAVGAVGAHSLGEPATQMTLKTFHFAGVASMNVTLGVPRIKEIINATKDISTPIIEAALQADSSEVAARIVKGRLEKTTLGQVSEYIAEVYGPSRCYIEVKLDLKAIAALHLDVTVESAARAIVGPALKLKHDNVHVINRTTLQVVAPRSGYRPRGMPARADGREDVYCSLQTLKAALPKIIVQGIPSVNRAVISEVKAKPGQVGKRHCLLVEGYSLLDVIGTPGVDSRNTSSNHIIEVEATLGIEAARLMIMKELAKTYDNYGIAIDRRHLMLLADVMTFRGEVLGITRFGIAKMKDSVLMLASFEKTPDHLFDAAVHARVDAVEGVSECIIMGIPIPLGTGLFKLLHAPGPLPPQAKPPAFVLMRGRQ